MKLPSVFICFASIALLLSGCTISKIPPSEVGVGAPPHQLIFYNEDEFSAFLDAPNLSDAELEQFLKDNNYSMNGVDSRELLDAVLLSITGKPFPSVKDAILTDVTVHMETNQLHARYEAETGEVYSFKYSLQEDLEAQKDSLFYGDAKIEDTFSVNTDDPFTAFKIRNDQKNIAGVYFIETPETIVLVRLSKMDREDIENNLQSIYFDYIG